jgi:hypothetical protein
MVRDRDEVDAEGTMRFGSLILPKCARRTKSLDALLRARRRISTGDRSRPM